MKEIRALAATGMLGTGFSAETFQTALKQKPHFIGCDAGTTDSGPYDLGSGTCNKSRDASARDLEIMLLGALKERIPLIIGSAGGAGAAPHVAWTLDILREIAKSNGISFSVAIIHADVDKQFLQEQYAQGKLSPLSGAPEISAETIGRSTRIVGMMGIEPFQKALGMGVDVVLAGRSSDTSIYASYPIMHGIPKGIAWHAAKNLECGAACVIQRLHPDCMLAYLDEDSFIMAPPNPEMACTPQSVISHTLYENSDPYFLYEPGGMLDTSQSVYTQLPDRRVRVTGSRFVESDTYTIRLEGVEEIGYRGIVIAGVRDPIIVSQIDSFLDTLRKRVEEKVKASLKGKISKNEYHLIFRVYGRNGVLGVLEPEKDILPLSITSLYILRTAPLLTLPVKR